VIAEYERAKIGERYRRGKLFRSRAGEVISRKAPYGYRRIPRGPDGPARLEIFEPEAAIARRIFADSFVVSQLVDDLSYHADLTGGQPETNRHSCLLTKRPGLGSARNRPGLTSWPANMIRPVQG